MRLENKDTVTMRSKVVASDAGHTTASNKMILNIYSKNQPESIGGAESEFKQQNRHTSKVDEEFDFNTKTILDTNKERYHSVSW